MIFPVKYLIRSAPQPLDAPVPQPDLSTPEGALQVITSATDGGAGSWGTNLMFNLPLVEGRFAVRAAFYDRDEGGYIDAIHVPEFEVGLACPGV